MEAIRLFSVLMQSEIIDSKWLDQTALIKVGQNICTLIHDQPLDSTDLMDCLANLIQSLMNIKKDKEETIPLIFLMRKARGFFKHELKNEPTEFLRRKLYYNSVLKVMKSMDFSSKLDENQLAFVNFVKKNVSKDRKQIQLEELA